MTFLAKERWSKVVPPPLPPLLPPSLAGREKNSLFLLFPFGSALFPLAAFQSFLRRPSCCFDEGTCLLSEERAPAVGEGGGACVADSQDEDDGRRQR